MASCTSVSMVHLMFCVIIFPFSFAFSFTNQKWQVADAGKRILEIQGVLELSVQRSSCEGDLNKDRLYAYMKEDGIMPLSGSANGTCDVTIM